MNDGNYTAGAAASGAIKVRLDPEILRDLIYGGESAPPNDERARAAFDRTAALREHQVYRLLRSVVAEFNARMKGRRERFKLVEEGDGLIIEFSAV